MKIKNAVICAAGLGSRLGKNMPKCMVEAGSHRIIYYLIKLLDDVPNVRVVVGYQAEEVMKYVKNIREDVTFIHNPDFKTTTNSYSLYLGSHDLKEPFINLDGDTLMPQEAFDTFRDKLMEGEDLVAVSPAYTEFAIYARLDENENIVEFGRDKISDYEWTGLAYFSNFKISKEGLFVYQELEKHLPIKGCIIESYEVDTPKDLEHVLKHAKFIE
ncbi:NTP transferase domain-containing protein [Cytophagaceae bacterium ABcell3]|nr:NTP transferase domain-containing protein [Cytophagaceae bacterium ABcell3]